MQDINQQLARIIQERMKERGMDWMEIEMGSGVNGATVRGWFKGRHGATLDAAARVLDAVGLKLVAVEAKEEQG